MTSCMSWLESAGGVPDVRTTVDVRSVQVSSGRQWELVRVPKQKSCFHFSPHLQSVTSFVACSPLRHTPPVSSSRNTSSSSLTVCGILGGKDPERADAVTSMLVRRPWDAGSEGQQWQGATWMIWRVFGHQTWPTWWICSRRNMRER